MTTLIYFDKKYKIPHYSLERDFQCAIIVELAKALKDAPPKTTKAKWLQMRDAAIKRAADKIVKEYKIRNGKAT